MVDTSKQLRMMQQIIDMAIAEGAQLNELELTLIHLKDQIELARRSHTNPMPVQDILRATAEGK